MTKRLSYIRVKVQTYFLLARLFFSQTGKSGDNIKGIVTDNITLVGQQGGTVSDENGRFSLNIKSFPITLSVSFLSYKTTEQKIDNPTSSLQILLEENTKLLDEVVIVGYGTQRRRELTGAVSFVSKQVLEQPTTSINELLSEHIAGLNVSQNSRQPGEGASIRIRGGNSIYASNEPLYVIDRFYLLQ